MSFLGSRLSRLQHLSDEVISRLIAGELGTVRGVLVRAHIDNCWRCRSRREVLEKAAMRMAEQSAHIAQNTPINPERRAALLADLRRRAELAPTQPSWTSFITHLSKRAAHQMHPVFASLLIIATAISLLFWVWQRSTPPVNAAQLLDRAAAADVAVSQEKNGVIYQKVRITSAHVQIDRELYRDMRRVRHRRPEQAKAELRPVHQILDDAGIDWEEPLAAASFREWHNRHPSIADEVREEGPNLRLISRVSNERIEEQSLTVRLSDFHPVGRTIETQSGGTIEMGELSYAVLPWQSINEALFESPETPWKARPMLAPSLPKTIDLDSAELALRAALNHLHADEGEQIEIVRNESAIEVKGVVDNAQRKVELSKGLRTLPHIRTEIFTIAELESAARNNRAPTPSINVASMDVQQSPLEQYLLARVDPKQDLAGSSQQLLEAALKIRQNGAEMLGLEKAFPLYASETQQNSIYVELHNSYSQRISVGLDTEVSVLRSLGFEAPHSQPMESSGVTLDTETSRNEALCRELISGSNQTTRPAAEIVSELFASVARIHSKLSATPASPQ